MNALCTEQTAEEHYKAVQEGDIARLERRHAILEPLYSAEDELAGSTQEGPC
jgi:hypothetical protein